MINRFYKIAKFKLFKLNRSLTGHGIRQSLKIIQKEFKNLKIKSVKSGTKVFDWTVPPEWNVIDSYVLDKFNKKIIDFKNNNLHLVGYSTPTKKILSKILKNYSNDLPNQIGELFESKQLCFSMVPVQEPRTPKEMLLD